MNRWIRAYFRLMRRFCRASGGEPSERRRSASRSHGAGRTDGASGARIVSAGSSGAVGLPDPPALESKTKQDVGGIQSRKQQCQSSKTKSWNFFYVWAAVGYGSLSKRWLSMSHPTCKWDWPEEGSTEQVQAGASTGRASTSCEVLWKYHQPEWVTRGLLLPLLLFLAGGNISETFTQRTQLTHRTDGLSQPPNQSRTYKPPTEFTCWYLTPPVGVSVLRFNSQWKNEITSPDHLKPTPPSHNWAVAGLKNLTTNKTQIICFLLVGHVETPGHFQYL